MLIGKTNRSKNGFTLIEVILYVGIIAYLMTSLVQFTINLFTVKNKSGVQQEVGSALLFVSSKLSYEIRQAKGINSATPTSISLSVFDPARNPTVFDLNNDTIRMGVGPSGSCSSTSPCPLTGSKIIITAFNLTNLSTQDTTTSNIRYQLIAAYHSPSARSEFVYSASLTGSAEIRSK